MGERNNLIKNNKLIKFDDTYFYVYIASQNKKSNRLMYNKFMIGRSHDIILCLSVVILIRQKYVGALCAM